MFDELENPMTWEQQEVFRLLKSQPGTTYQESDETGRMIRYGLCNDSAQLNKVIKSSDLVGIRPVVITPDMVGHTVGQFVAREVKRPGWSYHGTDREVAQAAFGQKVLQMGGDFKFCTGEGSL